MSDKDGRQTRKGQTELELSEHPGWELKNWELVAEVRGLCKDTQDLGTEGKNQKTKGKAWEIQSFKGQAEEEELTKGDLVRKSYRYWRKNTKYYGSRGW